MVIKDAPKPFTSSSVRRFLLLIQERHLIVKRMKAIEFKFLPDFENNLTTCFDVEQSTLHTFNHVLSYTLSSKTTLDIIDQNTFFKYLI